MPMPMPPKIILVGAPSRSREVVDCFYCEKSFERRCLKIHTKTIHKDCLVKEKLVKGQSTISFLSTKCNTNEPEAKKSKLDLHLDKSDYICIHCNEVFKDSDDFNFYTDQVHTKTKFTCEQCEVSFVSNETKFKCDQYTEMLDEPVT